MIGTSLQITQWLIRENDLKKQYEIKEYKPKRSLSQNAYCWELIVKIADIVRKSKDDVYYQMLKDYGQSEIISVRSNVDICGYFKYYEDIGKGKVNGNEFTHYKIFKGSSEYNTKEMSIFIDGIVQECKQLGIETLTPEQIAQLRSLNEQKN